MSWTSWTKIATATVAFAATSACTATVTEAEKDTAPSPSGAAPTGDPVAAASEAVAAGGLPTVWTGPTSAPEVDPDHHLFILVCSNASTGCVKEAAAAREAAESLGWEVTVGDGKYDPTVAESAIRNAVLAGADGILLTSTSPGTIQPALRFAEEQGVPVVNASDVESDDPLVAGDVPLPWEEMGALVGNAIIAESEGKAKVVVIRGDEFPGVKLRADALVRTLQTCDTCEILEETNVAAADAVSPKVAGLISAIADRNPDMTHLVQPYGATWSFVEDAIRSLDRPDLANYTYEGDPPEMAGCHSGLVNGIGAFSISWLGYAAVDQMNRVYEGEQPVDQNFPSYLITPENCAGAQSSDELATLDYASEYRKLWGSN